MEQSGKVTCWNRGGGFLARVKQPIE